LPKIEQHLDNMILYWRTLHDYVNCLQSISLKHAKC